MIEKKSDMIPREIVNTELTRIKNVYIRGIFLMLMILVIFMAIMHFQYMKALYSYRLLNGIPEEIEFGINGVYFPDKDAYCIDTKWRTHRGINSTEVHEQCHALINHNSKHFCQGVYWEENFK